MNKQKNLKTRNMQVEKLRKSDTHARNWVDYQNLY